MRQRLSTTGIFLLVALVVLVAVTGCERSAQEREAQATEAADMTTPGTVDSTPQPGTTVVSAVTPAPGGPTPIPTVVSGALTPAAPGVEPTATTSVIPAPPATEAPPPSGQQGEVVYHTVQRGDTVYSIARRYGSSVEAISRANNLVNPSQIYAGQKLAIPTTGGGTSGGTQPPTTGTGCRIKHTVKSGEWVWQIARNYGVSPYDILAANGMTAQSASTVVPGQVLCIP